jgi:cell wall-associated NlpC family hydrolase
LAGILDWLVEDCELLNQLNYEDLLQARWEKNGNSPQSINCYNLVRVIQARLGFDLPEITQLTEEEDILNGLVKSNINEVEKIEQPEPYCIVLFSIRPPYISHMGVVLPDGKFIHVLKGESVVVEKLNHLFWKNKIAGYYRCKKKAQ